MEYYKAATVSNGVDDDDDDDDDSLNSELYSRKVKDDSFEIDASRREMMGCMGREGGRVMLNCVEMTMTRRMRTPTLLDGKPVVAAHPGVPVPVQYDMICTGSTPCCTDVQVLYLVLIQYGNGTGTAWHEKYG